MSPATGETLGVRGCFGTRTRRVSVRAGQWLLLQADGGVEARPADKATAPARGPHEAPPAPTAAPGMRARPRARR